MGTMLIRSRMALSQHTLHLITLLVATIHPPCIRGAEPLQPSCPEDARTCEFYLEATPQFAMNYVDMTIGSPAWFPVRAQPWGLETGTDNDVEVCHIENRNLTIEGGLVY